MWSKTIFSLAAGLAISTAERATADFLPDRATLNTELGSRALNENFEKYEVVPRDPDLLGTTVLDASTIANHQGPGLAVPGVVFRVRPDSPSELQWNPTGYNGLVTKTISGGGNLITIDFTAPATAFGVGGEPYREQSMLTRATIYAADDTTVLGDARHSDRGAAQTFLGYSDSPAGIGKVELRSARKPFSSVIDDSHFLGCCGSSANCEH